MQLQEGKNVALITDAGTPLISDPGYHLVNTMQEHGISIIPIPGACAAIAALSVSGFPTNKFIFEGFLPPKSKQQLDRLRELANETRTMIFYESPHRLLVTLNNMRTIFGEDRAACLAKELTKTFETIYRGTLLALHNWLIEKPERQKGEFVILIKGMAKNNAIDPETLRILKLLSKSMSHKEAVILTSKITDVSKNILYNLTNY